VLWDCTPIAEQLGCARELADIAGLVARPGHARQRATASRAGIAGLVRVLSDSFSPRARIPRAHRQASLPEAVAAVTIG
jgi:hypothetical protein